MRNLKRALSLGLTAAMISGLMVMGSSAVSYPDSDEIQNQTAVEILGEIGVMVGDDNGNFNPTQDVTRAEMAVIITRILYGNDLNVDQFKGMNLFTDVPAWAEGFVNLCASLDIVAGVGDGKFAPNETVTAAQAALMLSRALGYFQNNAEFGNDWALAAIRRATSAGIIGDDMVLAANEGLSRDNVAQMTFNTLTKAVPVQYNELLNVYYNENQGITYALTFNYLQTLGYTNFDLVYDNGDTTIYGRPATTWGIGSYRTTTSDKDSGSRYDEALDANGGLISSNVQILSKDEIITIANEPTYTYTDATAEEDIYDDLGDARCNDQRGQKAEDEYDWTVYVNGEEVAADDVVIPTRNEGDDYAYTGEGVQTEIYVDDGDKTVTVVEINYYLAQVSSVDETEGTVSIRTISDLKADNAELDDRTFATTEFAEGDYVVFTIDQNADDDFYICEMTAPETVDGTVTRVNKNNTSDNSYLFLDRETRYDYSDHMAYDLNDETVVQHPSLEEDYTLFLDPNGYVLAYSGDTTKSFLYVQDSDEELSDWEARVVLADGTDDVVMVDDDLDNADDSAFYQTGDDEDIDWIGATRFNEYKAEFGTWPDEDELASYSETRTKISDIDYQIWEYETNADGDLYTLTGRTTRYEADVEINNGEAYIESPLHQDDILIDNSTIFVDVEGNVAYTGYDEVPDVSNAYIAYVLADDNDRDVAEIVYIIKGDFYDADAIFFVLTSADRDTEKYDGDYYFEFEDMYVDGHSRDGLYVSYDALIEAGIDSLDEDDADADRDRNTDAEIEDEMVGEVYKVLKSEDGTYITEIQHVDNWRAAEVATNSALWVYYTTMNGSDKWKTNSDTTYVLVEEIYDYDRNGDPIALDKYDVSEGGYSDIIEWRDWNDEDNDGYITTVQVLKAEDGTANLVYIYKYNPDFYDHDIIINVDGTQKAALDITNNFAELVNLAPYVSDKIGYSYTYSVSTVVDADGDPIVYEAPSNNVVQVDTRDVEEDIIINITTISNSVTNGNAILTVEYTDLNGADLDLARDDAIPQYVDKLGANYRFMLDLTGLTETEVASWNETVYINDVLMYGDLPKSGTVNMTTADGNRGMVQGTTSLEDMGLRVNAGDKVEIIVSNIVLDNEVIIPDPETNTLTLDGAAWKGAKVYSVDGKTDYPTTEETEFGQVVALTAEIPADVEEVVVVINDKQINVSMPGDVTLDENDLGVATGDKFTVTVDGKVVKYVDKGDASATDYNVTGVGTSFKMEYAGATTYWSYSTPVNNANLTGDIEIETGYVTVTDNANAVSGYATYNSTNYIKANTGVLTFTAAGTYSINGEVRENVSVGDTYTVGDKDVVIDTYQTAEELDEAVETAWAGIVATGKGPDYVSGGTMDIDLTTNTIAIEVNNGAAIKDTGLVALASALLGDGCTIVVSNGNDSVTLSGSVDPTDDVAALKGLLPTTAGIERTLTVVVTNADDQSVTYTVTYKQN